MVTSYEKDRSSDAVVGHSALGRRVTRKVLPRSAAPAGKSPLPRYRAPALEKGLDILELLSGARAPMTLSQISTRLDRSISELFRMAQVLESRGYVVSPVGHEGYQLSNKPFSLAANAQVHRDFVDCAAPHMQALCARTGQSCHLAVASDDQIVVVARKEAPGHLSLSIRIGFRRDLVGSTSGLVLYAFQRPAIRAAWRPLLEAGVSAEAWARFVGQAEQAGAQGFVRAESTYTAGVVDLSCPVTRCGEVIAALTIPFIQNSQGVSLDDSLTYLSQTAEAISLALED